MSYYATANGNHSIAYQWQFSDGSGAGFQNLVGQTNAALTVTDAQFTNAGEYRLFATNSLGSACSSAASLAVKPWSEAAIQWSASQSIMGLDAAQILSLPRPMAMEALRCLSFTDRALEARLRFESCHVPLRRLQRFCRGSRL